MYVVVYSSFIEILNFLTLSSQKNRAVIEKVLYPVTYETKSKNSLLSRLTSRSFHTLC